jgi:protein-S-isoprenylcysteine O-methyltransferase Ste14
MGKSYAARMSRLRVPLGLALGVLYLVMAQPTVRLLMAGAATALVGIFIRAWAAGYLEKNDRLATAGPYAWTRNPLYLGSLLIGVGLAVSGGSRTLTAVFAVYFLTVYLPVIRREETGLRERFGDEYESYAGRVPLFLPVPRKSAVGGERFRWERYQKNREYEAVLGYVAVIVFLCVKMMLR